MNKTYWFSRGFFGGMILMISFDYHYDGKLLKGSRKATEEEARGLEIFDAMKNSDI